MVKQQMFYNNSVHMHDHEMVDFIIKRFKQWAGFTKPKPVRTLQMTFCFMNQIQYNVFFYGKLLCKERLHCKLYWRFGFLQDFIIIDRHSEELNSMAWRLCQLTALGPVVCGRRRVLFPTRVRTCRRTCPMTMRFNRIFRTCSTERCLRGTTCATN